MSTARPANSTEPNRTHSENNVSTEEIENNIRNLVWKNLKGDLLNRIKIKKIKKIGENFYLEGELVYPIGRIEECHLDNPDFEDTTPIHTSLNHKRKKKSPLSQSNKRCKISSSTESSETKPDSSSTKSESDTLSSSVERNEVKKTEKRHAPVFFLYKHVEPPKKTTQSQTIKTQQEDKIDSKVQINSEEDYSFYDNTLLQNREEKNDFEVIPSFIPGNISTNKVSQKLFSSALLESDEKQEYEIDILKIEGEKPEPLFPEDLASLSFLPTFSLLNSSLHHHAQFGEEEFQLEISEEERFTIRPS